VLALPVGLGDALPAFGGPVLLVAAAGVGIASSVVPYVADQLALPRATYALMVSLLPATATVIGVIVLSRKPSVWCWSLREWPQHRPAAKPERKALTAAPSR
jgi:inner membrane transporter RhtA